MPTVTTADPCHLARSRLLTDWAAGKRPTVAELEAYLSDVPVSQRENALEDLITEHVKLSWRDDQGKTLEDYVAAYGQRFARFARLATLPFALIQEEFIARSTSPWAKAPTLADYLQRFPGREEEFEELRQRLLDGERYLKDRELDRGGQGIVWQGFDRHLRRLVALKEPLREKARDPSVLEEMANAARLTAALEHPAIVNLHEYRECPGAEPFYVMRLIHGDDLTKKIEDYHANADRWSASELRVRWHELLQAFVTICDAIAYAHSHGIIHRDLKPGNVKVGEFGETVVLDWGLAKRTRRGKEAEKTQTDQHELRPASAFDETATDLNGPMPAGTVCKGTYAYMSPEQLPPSHTNERTDIFGLGSILYHILTNRAPFLSDKSSSSHDSRLAAIREAQFPPPRHWKPKVSPALEAICLKAMAKAPERRYASAKDVKEDVQRYLADEPVSVYREPWPQRLGRWTRRHRTGVAAIGASLVAALIFLSVLLGFMEHSRQQLADEQARTELQRRAAEENFLLARKAIDQAFRQVVESPYLKRSGMQPLRKELLQTIIEFDVAFAQQQPADATVQVSLAGAYNRLAIAVRDIHRPDAIPILEKALPIFQKLVELFPNEPKYRSDLARVCSNLGVSLGDADQHEKAEAFHRQALAIREELVREHPATDTYQSELADSLNNLGVQLAIIGRLADAKSSNDRALTIREKLVRDHPKMLSYQEELSSTYNNLALWYAQVGDVNRVEDCHHKCLAVQLELVRVAPDNLDYQEALAKTYNNMGIHYREVEDLPKAEAIYADALVIRERMARENPDVTEYRSQLASLHNNRGFLFDHMDQHDKAEKAYQEGLTLQEPLVRAHPEVPEYQEELSMLYYNMGVLYQQLGRMAEAEALILKSHGIRQDLAAKDALPGYQQRLARSHHRLALLYNDLGRNTEAESHFRDGIAIFARLSEKHPEVATFRVNHAAYVGNLAILHSSLGKLKEAEAGILASQATLEKLISEFPKKPWIRKDYASGFNSLGNLYDRQKKGAEAEAAYRKAIELYRALQKDFPEIPRVRRDLAAALNNLGSWYDHDGGQSDKGKQLQQEALAIRESLIRQCPRVPDYQADIATSWHNLAAVFIRQQQWIDASAACNKEIAVLEPLVRDHPQHLDYATSLGAAYGNMGQVLKGQNNPAGALEWYDRASQVLENVFRREPRDAETRRFLLNTHLWRADAFSRLKRHAEAMRDWDRALTLAPAAKRSGIQLLRLMDHAHTGAHAAAFAAANELVAAQTLRSIDFYNLACVCSLCIPAAKDDAKLQEQYAARAVELLRQAKDKGFFDDHNRIEEMKKDDDLVPLRARPDYQKLLAELDAKGK